ncbi:fatty acid desaturase family protein [Luethyella okanaganae]|uniref:Fatty acid desaturase family protein n=1 Tax=Luethyella okanaganae TaxID=69372 RepID=A0ABW1VE06_9MICO
MSEVSTAPSVRIIRTKPGGDTKNPTTEYSALMHTVRNLGLLRRARVFYWVVFSILVVALGGAVTGFVLLGDTWYQLLIAGALGILLTQFAFLAHEASHRQVFESGRANDRAGRVLANAVVGISYSWWMTKHSRHHANPNVIGKDPDIDTDFIVFQPEEAAKVSRLHALVTRKQGWFFFPMLLLEGLNLHVQGLRTVMGRGKVDNRWLEIAMICTRLVAYLAVVFYFLPLGMAFAFIGVQLAVFGLYMGASFAPNHKGMPQLPHDSKVDFLRRQVLTSRNIRGGWVMLTFMGGLNYQIEHHLFPNMPRPHLRKAREIVLEYCQTHSIAYTETGLVQSYGIVIAYLNKVGLSARDPFDCPMTARFRTH